MRLETFELRRFAMPLLSIFLTLILYNGETYARPSDITFCGSTSDTPLCPPAVPHSLEARATSDQSKRQVIVRHYTLSLTTKTLWQACDAFTQAAVVNSTLPGPTLRVRAGEILSVRVYNHLESGTNLTMHFHGISMHMHPVMDGTTMVSQWPILPGKFFDYRIPMTAEDIGTYFYHSHVGVQAMTAYGVLIVEDPDVDQFPDPSSTTEEMHRDPQSVEFVNVDGEQGLNERGQSGKKSPYQYDEDRVIAIGDWWSYSGTGLIEQQLGHDPFIWPGSASKLLFNGVSAPTPNVATAACNQTKADLVGVSCASAPNQCMAKKDYPTIQLDYDKTYRLRFVGATSLMYVSAAILKPTSTPYGEANASMEDMKLIEADGAYLDAFPVQQVELTTGQRYSALYRSHSEEEIRKDGSGGVYWMRVESRWRTGPSMWVKLVYPKNDQTHVLPPVDGGLKTDVQILPKETFGWVTASLSPLSKAGGPSWWYSHPVPGDDEVTRTVVIDTQQVKFFPSLKGVKWAEDGQLFNESNPSPSPYLVRTFLGDITFPTPEQFETALYNPTTYNTNAGVRDIISKTDAEINAAKRRHWKQGYSSQLNMYFANTHEVIDIVIVNRPSELSKNVEIHPWHMHSTKHWTRTIQPGTFSFTRLEQLYSSKSSSGYEKPIQRDTTIAYASPGAAYLNATVADPTENDGGFAVLRYKVDSMNAGVFLLHCHIQFHLAMGMGTVWTIAPHQLADKTGIYWPTSPNQNNAHGSPTKPNIQGLDYEYLKYDSNVEAVF